MLDDAARGRAVTTRFLQTAVVVDDEAYMSARQNEVSDAGLVVPGRRRPAARQVDARPSGNRGKEHTLDAKSVIGSFATLGVVCGVVGPSKSAMGLMRQADIVVLDWRLQEESPDLALELLRDLLTGEQDRNSLRLVAIYTGESRLEDIHEAVIAQLKESGLDPVSDESNLTIRYRHGRVVLYAKSGVKLATHLTDRCVAEEELPGRLVDDFSAMTEGLLPRIALTSLTAFREGAHMVLDQFRADLDPAFLAHRACLPNPEDAELQIVSQVAEELHGLMGNAVAVDAPAGTEAVEGWIRRRNTGAGGFAFGEKQLDLDQTIKLATGGLQSSDLTKNDFGTLTAGFAGDDIPHLDERLAWIMSFRTVFNAPLPTLWLGSVVTERADGRDTHLLCMRPRCDCVRLTAQKTSFFFLPLVEPRKVKAQLVVKLDSEFKRLGIDLDPAGWVRRHFARPEGGHAVTATKEESSGRFVFTDIDGVRYRWQGELKAEYAQRIAHTFAMTFSRVAVEESEWLRRTAQRSN